MQENKSEDSFADEIRKRNLSYVESTKVDRETILAENYVKRIKGFISGNPQKSLYYDLVLAYDCEYSRSDMNYCEVKSYNYYGDKQRPIFFKKKYKCVDQYTNIVGINVDLMISKMKDALSNDGLYVVIRKVSIMKNNTSGVGDYGDAVLVYVDCLPENSDQRDECMKMSKVINYKEGCYIATCIYGSYDCPQVWALRRYRDNYLQRKNIGRAFIHCYYAISPKLVKAFGDKTWFRAIWKGYLDKKVEALKNAGYEDTPYED